MDAYRVYLILSFLGSFFFTLCFSVNMIYQATVVGLNPLQLVLVGTTLEVVCFLFEIPTGIVADVKSRRLSIIIGYAMIGIGFVVEGSFPFFWAMLLSQVIWGIGSTFTSGATEAWLADELGEDRVGHAFVRGSQAGSLGGLVGVPVSVWIGQMDIAWPIVISGCGMIGLCGFLLLAMKETGFQPVSRSKRMGTMLQTMADARTVLSGQWVLIFLMLTSLFWGLHSEGFDRLWTPHVIDNVGFPGWGLEPVVWFGIIQMVGRGLHFVGLDLLRRSVDMRRVTQVAHLLITNTALMTLLLVGFGLAQGFWLAAGLLLAFNLMRGLNGPLYDTWFNAQVRDSQVRATLFSVRGQMNAMGPFVGGPIVGWIGLRLGLRWALVTAAMFLAPVAGCLMAALKWDKQPLRQEELDPS